MAYIPTAADFDEGYKPTLADFEEPRANNEPGLFGLKPRQTLMQNLNENSGKVVDAVIAGGRGVQEGIKRFGSGINQFALPPVDKVLGTNLSGKAQAIQQGDDARFEQEFGNNPAAKGGRFVGEILPSLAPAGATFKIGSRLLNKAPVARELAGLASAGAAQGAVTYDPSYQIPIDQKAELGAGTALLTGGLLKSTALADAAITKALSKMGDISPAEMKAAIETHKGLKTGLGDIINSPSLKYTRDNMLETVPFSGVRQNQVAVAKQLTGEAENILNKLRPKKFSENFGEDVINELKKQDLAARNIKNQKYNEANEFAESSGAKVNPKNYMQQINAELSNLDNLIIPSSQKSELADILQNARNFNKPNLSQTLGASTPGESFKKTYLTKGYLNNAYEEALKKNDAIKMGMVGKIRDALKSDVANSVEQSGIKELQNKFKQAEDYYKNDYAKFKDKDILKFTRRGETGDKLENYFIRPGKNDQAQLLSKLMDKLPEDMNKTLAYRYLSNAYRDKKFGTDDLDAIKLSTLYNSLGERTRAKLFPYKDVQEDMKKLAARMEKNQEALNTMYNPKTGSRVGDWMGLAATVPSFGTSILGAKAAEKFLTSERVRQKYLDAITKYKKGGIIGE